MKPDKIIQIHPTEYKDSEGNKKIIIYCVTKSGSLYACIFDPETKKSSWGELGTPLKK